MNRIYSVAARFALYSILFTGSLRASVLVGTTGVDANAFPFGFKLAEYPATVYQQVYSAGAFPGPITIVGIEFFKTVYPTGNFNTGTYTLSLSTTSKAVDGLDVVDFASNIGADNQPFAVLTLNGGTASGFTVFGTAFNYDPSAGNLLLNMDVIITAGSTDVAPFDSLVGGTPNGLFSRAHNFGIGYVGFGLVTNFVTADPVPEPATLFLVGGGLLAALLTRRRTSSSHVTSFLATNAGCLRRSGDRRQCADAASGASRLHDFPHAEGIPREDGRSAPGGGDPPRRAV